MKLTTMGKSLLLLTTLTLTTKAFADHSNPRLKVEKKISILKDILLGIDQSLYQLRGRSLKRLNNKLDMAINELSNRGRDPHYSDHRGPNTRPMPPVLQRVTVTGTIESMRFTIDANNASDFAYKCAMQFNRKLGITDDATVSVNFGPVANIKTRRWWNSSGEVCSAIATRAVNLGLPTRKTVNEVVAIGSVEDVTIAIKGYSIQEIHRKCMDIVNTQVFGSVDELTIFNGISVVNKKTNGWYSGPGEVCQIFVSKLNTNPR